MAAHWRDIRWCTGGGNGSRKLPVPSAAVLSTQLNFYIARIVATRTCVQVLEACEPDEVLPKAMELAESIAKQSPVAVGTLTRTLV